MLATMVIPQDVIDDLAAEVQRARAKFPRNRALTVALMEEVGELAQAQLQQLPTVRKEAIQVMALAFRILSEGDASIPLDDEAKQK
jgi:NTP pyrophosphatase (non-canonical NTP hydrolase)